MQPRICVLMTSLLCLCTCVRADPLPKRIWQLHDYDMKHMARVVDMAAEYGITEIQLSHDIVMDADQVLESPALAADINSVCTHAHDKGLRVSVWTHELERVPDIHRLDGKPDLNDAKLWEWLRRKYERLFAVCPDIDGLVLTFHETQVSVYHDSKVISDLSAAGRVALLIDTIASVCKPHGKELIVRSFCYEPSELQFIRDGLSGARSDFVVMTKCQPHDWQPYYPDNPLIGDVGGRKQVVEFDCGHEFLGQADIPYIDARYMKSRLDYGVSQGIVGAVARIERKSNHALDTPNWANVHVFSRLLQQPESDADPLLRDYLTRRYGKAAMPKLHSAMRRTFRIVNQAYFILGFWVTDHSGIPSVGYALERIEHRGVDKWDADPKWREIRDSLLSPDAATLDEVLQEKDEALDLCRRSIADVQAVKGLLRDDDYRELMSLFRREEAVVITWSADAEALLSMRAYEVLQDETFKSRAESSASDLLECSTKYADELRAVSGDGGSDNVARLELFVAEVRARLAEVAVKGASQ